MVAHSVRRRCVIQWAAAAVIAGSFASPLEATDWTGGTNEIFGNDVYTTLRISGGLNTVFGDEGTNLGRGSITISSGGLEFFGSGSPNLTLNSDLTEATAGALILNGNVSFTGSAGASITSGLAGPVGGTVFLTSPAVASGDATRTFTIANGSAASDLLISARIANGLSTGSLTKDGAGTMTLSGSNAYTGITTLTGGTLSVATIGNGGAVSGIGAATNAATNIVFDGGTLQYTGVTATSDRAFTINATKTATIDITANSLTLFGGTSTNGALTKVGNGTLIFNGTSTYTGDTTITAGTLQVGSGGTTGSLAPSGAIINNSVLAINRSNATVQGVDFSGTAIGGNGALNQIGSGTTTLNQANSYSGATTIAGGTLLANNTTGSATGTGNISFSGTGGTFGGTGTVTGTVTISNVGSIAPGSPGTNSGVGALTTGGQEWMGGGTYVWELKDFGGGDAFNPNVAGEGTDWDLTNASSLIVSATPGQPFKIQIVQSAAAAPSITNFSLTPSGWFTVAKVAGGVTDGTSPLTNAVFKTLFVLESIGGEVWEIQLVGSGSGPHEVQVRTVPEPTSLSMVAFGAIGLLTRRRRRPI